MEVPGGAEMKHEFARAKMMMSYRLSRSVNHLEVTEAGGGLLLLLLVDSIDNGGYSQLLSSRCPFSIHIFPHRFVLSPRLSPRFVASRLSQVLLIVRTVVKGRAFEIVWLV